MERSFSLHHGKFIGVVKQRYLKQLDFFMCCNTFKQRHTAIMWSYLDGYNVSILAIPAYFMRMYLSNAR